MLRLDSLAIWLPLTVAMFSTLVSTEFTCVCTYDRQTSVYEQPTDTSALLGYMHALDCKPGTNDTTTVEWAAIAFQNQVGFISTKTGIEIHTCSGDPSVQDRLTTAQVPGASTSTQPITATTSTSMGSNQPSTTIAGPTTNTAIPTTPSTATASNMTLGPYVTYGCSQKYIDLANGERGILFTYEHTCYEIVPQHVTWGEAENDCVKKGGHLAHIANSSEQNAIYEVVTKVNHHSVWIGLNDIQQEEHFEWTSGDPVGYTHWSHSGGGYNEGEDCIVMATGNWHGRWEDMGCGNHYGYICEFGAEISPQIVTTSTTTTTTTTQKPDINSDGNIHICPRRLSHDATYGYHVAQFGAKCYELGQNYHTFYGADMICRQIGGRLADVTSADEQAFIQAFASRYSPHSSMWIGLNDRTSEGHFVWTSGAPVSYTNWLPDRQSYYQEDCVVFIPYKSGGWDDVNCGDRHSNSGRHVALCEFPVNGQSSSSSSSSTTLNNGAVLVG